MPANTGAAKQENDMSSAKMAMVIEDGGQQIGTWSVDTAPNSLLRNLIAAAIEDGESATTRDAEGCEVCASVLYTVA